MLSVVWLKRHAVLLGSMALLLCVGGVALAQTTEPSPSPTPGVITPDTSSSTVTNLTLLIVAVGGLAGALTPLILGVIKLLRKSDIDPEEVEKKKAEQKAKDDLLIALAMRLAESQGDVYVGRERREADSGPPDPPGTERRGVGE